MNNPMNRAVKCYVCERYIKGSVDANNLAWSKVAVQAVGLVRHKSCYIGSRRWWKSKWSSQSNMRWLYTDRRFT